MRSDGAAVAPVIRLTEAEGMAAVRSVAGSQGLAVGIETAGSVGISGAEVVVARTDGAPSVTVTTGQYVADHSVRDGASLTSAPDAPSVAEGLGAPSVQSTDAGAVVLADDDALTAGLADAAGTAAVEFGVLAEAAGSARGGAGASGPRSSRGGGRVPRRSSSLRTRTLAIVM